MVKNKGLGKGVGLLFEEEQERYFDCNIEDIKPNKHQPRTIFNADDLDDLSNSIKENGVIQPLIITNSTNGTYELIAGERRLRASKLAGLSEVPVILIDVDDEDTQLELALIENVQRTDLNAIEEAEGYKKLINKFGYTQEEAAKKVGKKRATVTNLLRLLKLPKNIQNDISEGILSEGHGRALIRLIDDPKKLVEIRNLIINEGLSVRAAEKIIKKSSKPKGDKKNIIRKESEELPKSYRNAIITQLTNRLNSKVNIAQNGNRGKIEIEYYSVDDLDRVTAVLLGE